MCHQAFHVNFPPPGNQWITPHYFRVPSTVNPPPQPPPSLPSLVTDLLGRENCPVFPCPEHQLGMLTVEDDVFQRISWNVPQGERNLSHNPVDSNVYMKSLRRIAEIFKIKRGNKPVTSRSTASAWEEGISNREKATERDKCTRHHLLYSRTIRQRLDKVRCPPLTIRTETVEIRQYNILSHVRVLWRHTSYSLSYWLYKGGEDCGVCLEIWAEHYQNWYPGYIYSFLSIANAGNSTWYKVWSW